MAARIFFQIRSLCHVGQRAHIVSAFSVFMLTLVFGLVSSTHAAPPMQVETQPAAIPLSATVHPVPTAPQLAAPQPVPAVAAPGVFQSGQVGKDPAAGTGLLPVALVIGVAPYGDVFVDGDLVATATKRVRVFLDPGMHRVEVKHPLATAVTQDVFLVDQDAATEIRVRLAPTPATLRVTANKGFTASIDGRVVGRGERNRPVALTIPLNKWAGQATATVVLTATTGQIVRLPIQVTAGAELSQRVTFEGPIAAVVPISTQNAATMAW